MSRYHSKDSILGNLFRITEETYLHLNAADHTCTRATGSLGLFDIVVLNHQGVRLIQVKTNRDVSPGEWEAIELFNAMLPGRSKEIWIFRDYARTPIMKEVG